MRRTKNGSVALDTVEAFLAAAAYGNYTEAGAQLQISRTTVMRRLQELEFWLHLPLLTIEELDLTEFGDNFSPIAIDILSLVEVDNLKADLSNIRVHSDGILTIAGETIKTGNADKIGKLLTDFRADLGRVAPTPSPISPNDPLILRFLDDNSNGEKLAHER